MDCSPDFLNIETGWNWMKVWLESSFYPTFSTTPQQTLFHCLRVHVYDSILHVVYSHCKLHVSVITCILACLAAWIINDYMWFVCPWYWSRFLTRWKKLINTVYITGRQTKKLKFPSLGYHQNKDRAMGLTYNQD